LARFYIGLDLGQSRDYTAIAVAEKIEPTEAGGRDFELLIRHLERFRDEPYPDVALRVRRVMDAPELRAHGTAPALAVDATGVGKPVVDMLRSSGLTFDAVTIHGGDTQSEDPASGSYRVPKRDLVGGLQVLLQSGRLKIARELTHAETLKSELLNFRVKINIATSHDSYEAWREGDHDDLLLATALACWEVTRPGPTLVMI
jgi:phage FluMu gp28-like protein